MKRYNQKGRLSTVSNDVFRVEYHYSPDGYDAGYTLTAGGGVSITRSLTRDPYRRQLVTSITNTLNTVTYCPLNYTYDELNRVTKRNGDTFGYNQRSEVVSADIEPSHSSRYDFDQIGNNRWTSLNTATNYYTANPLNQYTDILCASASPREMEYDFGIKRSCVQVPPSRLS